jgi:hypothetical protein
MTSSAPFLVDTSCGGPLPGWGQRERFAGRGYHIEGYARPYDIETRRTHCGVTHGCNGHPVPA